MKDKSELTGLIQSALIWTAGLSLIAWFLVPNSRLIWRLSNALTLGSIPGLTLACFRLARRWGLGDSFLYATRSMRRVLKKDSLERKIEKGKADQEDLEEADRLNQKPEFRDFHDYLQNKPEPKPVLPLLLVNGAALAIAAVLTLL